MTDKPTSDKPTGDKIVPLTQQELQKYLDNSPFISFLGLKVTEADPARETVTMTCAFRPEFERGPGTAMWPRTTGWPGRAGARRS